MQRGNFQATCGACGKLGYTTKSKAKDALRRTKNAGSVAVKPDAVLRVYPCDAQGSRNGLFHVGHRRTRIGTNWNDGAVRFLPGEGGCVT